MSDVIVEIQNLSRTYANKRVLRSIDLELHRGQVLGLVGGNGAGKTTLVKHIMGLLKAEEGSVRVFGRNPVQDPIGVLSQIGYLSEDRDLPMWMTVNQLVNYTQAFYPDWDSRMAQDLCDKFELVPVQKVKSLSRGQLARLGLLLALSHRPALLVLDEPSSGLDPIVRRDILTAVIRSVVDDGRTVLFSSHLLDEVERVADRIALLSHGRLLLNESLDMVKSRHRLVTVKFPHTLENAPFFEDTVILQGEAAEWKCLSLGGTDRLRTLLVGYGAEIIDETTPTLDEIFFALSKAKPEAVTNNHT